MTKTLRKRHFIAWTILAVLLPVIIITARVVIPVEQHQSLLQPGIAKAFPVVIRQTEEENYSVALRCNTDSIQWQLEWINKNALTFPTATIYFSANNSNDIKSGRLLGRIEARGAYYFPLDDTFHSLRTRAGKFIVYDFIHQQIIDTLKL